MPAIATALLAACEDSKIERPCADAVEWLGQRRSMDRTWRACPRGDWLLWLLGQVGVRPSRVWVAREIVAHAFDYAADALDGATVDHSLREHAAALRTCDPDTVDEVLRAAWAAARAARAAGWVAGWAAARAAGWVAARAAWEAARAAWAAEAAWGAAIAAGAAGAAEHDRCARAVRALYPAPPAEVLALFEVSQ